jgi:mono/diheme cytochrome c family protein
MCRCETRGSRMLDAGGRVGIPATGVLPPASLATIIALVLTLPGCVQEMANQPRYEALEASEFFEDSRASRHPVEGSVARGQLQLDDAFFTGKENGELISELPARAFEGQSMAELLARGQNRFGVFCAHCHGQVGGGLGGSESMREMVGMVVKRGFPVPPTYHQPRLREAPIGYFFDVITNGFGRMPAHGYLLAPADRWAIAAYVRALQLSQHAGADQLLPSDLQSLEEQATSDMPRSAPLTAPRG